MTKENFAKVNRHLDLHKLGLSLKFTGPHDMLLGPLCYYEIEAKYNNKTMYSVIPATENLQKQPNHEAQRAFLMVIVRKHLRHLMDELFTHHEWEERTND